MSRHSYQQPYGSRPERRRSPLVSCLLFLTILVLLLLALVAAVLVFVRPRVSEQAGRLIGNQLEQQLRERMRLQAEAAEIPPDFAGEVVVSDAEVNAYLAQHPESLAPLDAANVQFVPGELVVDVSAYGATGQARAGLTVQDGRVVVVNPTLEGPLSYIMDAQSISQALEQELNNQLAAQGQQLTDVRIEQGQLIATVQPR